MDYEQMINDQLADLDLRELEDIMQDAAEQSNGIFEALTTEDIIDSLISGEALFNTDLILENVKDVLLMEVKAGILMGVEILTVCIIMGLLGNITDSFGNKAASTLGNTVCSCLVIILCLTNFKLTYNACSGTLDTMTNTMQILLPILIPLLIGIGGFSSGSILNPVIITAVTGFNTVLQTFVLPLIFISGTFILLNSLTEKSYLQQLAVFLRKAAIYTTGLIVTVFTGITAIQGIVTKSADGLLVNTARYSISNFVPIIGKFASDSVDMVLSCAAIIKNSIGLLGIIMILCLLSGPVIKLIAVAIIYKITAIFAEPISTKQVSSTLAEMGSSVVTMTVVLGLSALMFLIFLTIIISIGGGTLWK